MTFDKVLAVSDGDKTNFGVPFVKNATVTGQILAHGKDKKIIVFKFKAKKAIKESKGTDSRIQK